MSSYSIHPWPAKEDEPDFRDDLEYQERVVNTLLDAMHDYLQFGTVRQLLKLIAEHL